MINIKDECKPCLCSTCEHRGQFSCTGCYDCDEDVHRITVRCHGYEKEKRKKKDILRVDSYEELKCLKCPPDTIVLVHKKEY